MGIQWRNDEKRYGLVGMALHWVMAISLIGMLAGGNIMEAMSLSPLKFELYNFHKAFGITLFAAVFMRLGWRLINPPPPAPATHKRWERLAAHSAHYALYGLMIAMPLSGWLFHSTQNFPSSFFGLFPIPNIVSIDQAAATATFLGFLTIEGFTNVGEVTKAAHYYMGWALVGIIAVHAGAALKHHYIDKDAVLTRMATWPRRILPQPKVVTPESGSAVLDRAAPADRSV